MPTPSPTTMSRLLAKYVHTSSGRQRFAARATGSLRRFRDYTAVGRKAFLVDTIQDGALPIYDKDPIISAFVIGNSGDAVSEVVGADRVNVPLFTLSSLIKIPLTEIRERRYNVIKRSVELGTSNVKSQEDVRVFASAAALALSSDNPNTDIAVSPPLTGALIAEAFAKVEQYGLRVARMFVNPIEFSQLRTLPELDMIHQHQVLKTGVVGNLFGAQVIRSRVVPQGTVIVCAEREFFGRFVVRQELSVISADNSDRLEVGFNLFENIGVLTYNALAQQRMILS